MKRLACFLDGTWNNDDDKSIVTNIVKLHRSVADEGTDGIKQNSFYVTGISARQGIRSKFLKGALGLGVGHRIKEGYLSFVKNYNPGDELLIFGFSRGAFEARSLAGFITLFGIAKKGSDGACDRAWLDEAWGVYRQAPNRRDAAALERLRADAIYPVRIKCVGVYDTVGNIGNPFFASLFNRLNLSFHDTRLLPSIDVALQGLAIDEVRGPFRPTLWTMPVEDLPEEGKNGQAPANQIVEQVWFAGTHADVGGGYEETALSDVALGWMMERVTATTGFQFDKAKLDRWSRERISRTTKVKLSEIPNIPAMRPNPLGAQHSSANDGIFALSNLFPFIRLIRQHAEAIPSWRSSLISTWRSGKLPEGLVSINESIHPSVAERYNNTVIELRGTQPIITTYAPAALAHLVDTGEFVPKTPAASGQAPPLEEGKKRRVKVFVVHGTFAHDTDWIPWDDTDPFTARAFPAEKSLPPPPGHHPGVTPAQHDAGEDAVRAAVNAAQEIPKQRQFINRLSEELWMRDVILAPGDFTAYSWSGGNSHDERRTGAIGLKHTIEAEINKKKAEGVHYDSVYVIGHSHGGTIARLAVNTWDKDFNSYTPLRNDEEMRKHDGFKLDDDCPTCFQKRNGRWIANSVPRPNAIITLGSPFVMFEPRRAGLLTARIAVGVFRAMALIPALALLGYFLLGLMGAKVGAKPLAVLDHGHNTTLQAALLLAWPIPLYWLLIHYLPRRFLAWSAGQYTKRSRWYANVAFAVMAITGFGILSVVWYYILYLNYFHGFAIPPGCCEKTADGFIQDHTYIGRYLGLGNLNTLLAFLIPITLYWLIAVHFPSRFLTIVEREVVRLKSGLPKKYDPREDRPVRYLAFTTPGDEAAFGLQSTSILTFLVQTLSLAAACVMAFGLLLFVYIGTETIIVDFLHQPSLLSRIGYSAWDTSNDHKYQKAFIALYNYLVWLPEVVWQAVSRFLPIKQYVELHLEATPAGFDVVKNIPWALVWSAAAMLAATVVLAIPVLVILHLILRWLRTTMVFGAESFTWTLANRIVVSRRANSDTMVRTVYIAHEAWPKMQLAHCYYYFNSRVIGDIADYISGSLKHDPDEPGLISSRIAGLFQWLVVLLFVLSIFAFAVPIATHTDVFEAAIQRFGCAIGNQFGQKCDLETPESAPPKSSAVRPAPPSTPADGAYPAAPQGQPDGAQH
jgi:uncharacterized protein (DUF2235 family)